MGEIDIVNKPDRFELTILIAGQIISVYCSYYFILMALCIRLILIVLAVVQRKRQIKIQQIQNKLISYPWTNHHRIIKNCLQFMKCIRMIEQGYDSKSNTNIILQEEKQSKYDQTTTINQDLSNIGKTIVEVVNLLIKIKNQINIILEKNGQDTQEDHISEIKWFRDIFKTNKKIDYLYEQISKSISELQRLRNVKNNIKIRRQERNREKNIQVAINIDKYEKLLLNLSLLSLSQFLKMQLDQQFNIFLSTLTTKSNLPNNLQPLINFVNQCQQIIAQKNKDRIIPIPQLHPQQLEHPLQQIHERQQDQSHLNQKKQFMKKLDSLLMIGLAQKRQQQFQQKMKLLQQQQLKNLHQ